MNDKQSSEGTSSPMFRSSSKWTDETTLWTNKIECILNSPPSVNTLVQQNEVFETKERQPRCRESANGGYQEESGHVLPKFIPPITTHNESHATRPRFIPPTTTYEDSTCASVEPKFSRSMYGKREVERGSLRSNRPKFIPPKIQDKETPKSKLQRPRRATVADNIGSGDRVGSPVFNSNGVEHSKKQYRPRHLRRRTTEYETLPSKMAVNLSERSLYDGARKKSVQMSGVKPCFQKPETELKPKPLSCSRNRRITIEGPCPFTALQMNKKRDPDDSSARNVTANLQRTCVRDVSPELDESHRTPYSYESISMRDKSVSSVRTQSKFKEYKQYKSPSPPRLRLNSPSPLCVPRRRGRRCTLNDASLSCNSKDHRLNRTQRTSPDTTNISSTKRNVASLIKDKQNFDSEVSIGSSNVETASHIYIKNKLDMSVSSLEDSMRSEKEMETGLPMNFDSTSSVSSKTHVRTKSSRISSGNESKSSGRKLSSRRATTCNVPKSEGIAMLPFKRLHNSLSRQTSDSDSRSDSSRNQLKNREKVGKLKRTGTTRKNGRRATDFGTRLDSKTAHNLRRYLHSPESFEGVPHSDNLEEEECDLNF